ncbi:MAG: IS256 family transposase [Syntrophaceae bacterium]|nr:IS256 family transposase [Syntrophaceae bacterium]
MKPKEKVTASERICKDIHEIFNGDFGLAENLDASLGRLMTLSFKRILVEALEAEVSAFLGRGYYSRGESARPGYRNGYENKTLRTSEGKIGIPVPQVRDSGETYRSPILANIPRITPALEKAAIEAYVRGSSTRDIEDVSIGEDGESLMSKDRVSAITETLWEEYNQFQSRDLSGLDVVYLFVDGVYESLRKRTGMKEAVLCAWGILSDGKKVLISLAQGNKESHSTWREFFRDMVGRGLRMPLLVVQDGNPGGLRAAEEVFWRTKRQRCIAHKLRNIANKLPRNEIENVLPRFKAVYYAESREIADILVAKIVEDLSGNYPGAVKCMLDDLDACLAHLEFPPSHRRYIRTTNLLERCFVEEKRRTKVIPGFLTEKSALKLVFGTLIRVSEKWKNIKMTPLELELLRNLRKLMGGKENEKFISFSFEKVA